MQSNIILIGMPGSGKSTVGVQLAKQLGFNFIDTDLLIQRRHDKTLQEILNEEGYLSLRKKEEYELLQLQLHKDLVATGGSAVYSDQAMNHLRQQGRLVYLQVSFSEICHRVKNEGQRGIARPPEHSLLDVYEERVPLYEKHADITINNDKPASITDIALQLQQP